MAVGKIPRVSGCLQRKPLKSQKLKMRALRLCAAEHGLFLKVGPLLYEMGDAAGVLKRLDAAAAEQETGGFARRLIHQMHSNLRRQSHFVEKGHERNPMWVSVKQKAAALGGTNKVTQ